MSTVMWPLRFRLSVKLPLFVVLAVVLTAGAGSVTAIALGRAVLRADALAESAARLDIYVSAVKFYVDQARSLLETTAGLALVERVSLHRGLAAVVLAKARVFEYVMLLQPDGTVVVLEPEALERQLSHRDISFLAWYRSLVDVRATVVSDLHISPVTQRPTVVIATPVRSARGEMIGILAGALRLDELTRLGRGPAGNAGNTGHGYLTDRRGLIIAHQGRPSYVENQTDFSAVPTVRAALAGQRGTLELVNQIEGEARLGAYRPLEDLGWAAAYEVPARIAFAPVEQMTRGIMLASTVLAVAMGGMGFLVAQRIVRPLKLLTSAARTIGTGEFGERIHMRTGDEIEQLADEMNEAARRSAGMFRDLLEFAPDAVVIADSLGRIVIANAQAEQMFGYAREELLGRPVEMLLPERVRDTHVHHRAAYHAAPRTRPMGGGLDLLGRRKDGSEVPVEISLSQLQTEGGLLVMSVVRDVTERKRAEEEIKRLNQDLERRVVERTADLEAANKELDAFAYSVSHDLRAPLRAMDGFSRMLVDKYAPQLPDEARRYVGVVRKSSQEMGQLIDNLLSFSRLGRQAVERRTVSLSRLAREAFEDLRAEHEGRRVELVVGDLPECEADPRLLKHVFVNLLSNALKFTRGREVARIEVGGRCEEGEHVCFVRDNGVGFDMRYVDKLFGVFQRLHRAEDYEGTGVGLAIVQRIVHRHGGRVWAEGMLDQGATVYFTLEGGTPHA